MKAPQAADNISSQLHCCGERMSLPDVQNTGIFQCPLGASSVITSHCCAPNDFYPFTSCWTETGSSKLLIHDTITIDPHSSRVSAALIDMWGGGWTGVKLKPLEDTSDSLGKTLHPYRAALISWFLPIFEFPQGCLFSHGIGKARFEGVVCLSVNVYFYCNVLIVFIHDFLPTNPNLYFYICKIIWNDMECWYSSINLLIRAGNACLWFSMG